MKNPRVVIIGARGIGRHHAKWWHIEGAHPIGFLGTRPETVAITTQSLKETFSFEGQGFLSFQEMMEVCQPQIVDICSPPETHWYYIHQTLQYEDISIVCEKPLIFDPSLTIDDLFCLLGKTRKIFQNRSTYFLMTTQYTALMAHILEKRNQSDKREAIQEMEIILKTPGRDRTFSPSFTWIDLGPHLLAMVQTLLPNVQPVWSTLTTKIQDNELLVDLDFEVSSIHRIAVHFCTGRTIGDPKHIKRIRINQDTFSFYNAQGPDGHFALEIEKNGEKWIIEDPMRVLFRNFLKGISMFGIEQSLTNTEWLFSIYQRFR